VSSGVTDFCLLWFQRAQVAAVSAAPCWASVTFI